MSIGQLQFSPHKKWYCAVPKVQYTKKIICALSVFDVYDSFYSQLKCFVHSGVSSLSFFASLYFMFSYYNIHLWNLHDCSSLAYALNFFPFLYYSATSCWTIAFCHTSLSSMINLFYLFYLHWHGRFQAIHWVHVVNWIYRRWTIITKLLQKKKQFDTNFELDKEVHVSKQKPQTTFNQPQSNPFTT